MHTRPTTARDVQKMIKERGIRYVDFKFVDLFGRLQHITTPSDVVDEDTFLHGLTFDGSSIRGFQRINQSDLLLKPDAASIFHDPFYDDPTLSAFCDLVDPVGHKPYARDPRGIARKAERLVQSLGIADTANFGPELEFFIFDHVEFDQSTQHGYYFLDAEAAFWRTGQPKTPSPGVANLGHHAGKKQGYFAAPPIDRHHNLRSKMSSVLREVGLQPELHHHEVGAAGQCEIGFRFGSLVEQADAATKYKYVVKNVAQRYGKTVTFMPKPLHEEAGSGMHVNLSLAKEGKNLFYEAGKYADLSELALHFIGGILAHARALCAICAPSTNSYRRLMPGYEAPTSLCFSARNRSACIRIPMVASGSKRKRIEFRSPDPTCNPYLAFAAILLAGVDGIIRRTAPPAPVDEDIYEYASKHKLESMPVSLEEALLALERDHEFLLREDVFSQDFVKTWVETKRTREVDFIRSRPHPGEFALYFNT